MRSTRNADSSQISAHPMNAWRELSFVACSAHSKDSSAHAQYSAAVIIRFKRNEPWASWIERASAIRSNAIPDLRRPKLRRSLVRIDLQMSLTAPWLPLLDTFFIKPIVATPKPSAPAVAAPHQRFFRRAWSGTDHLTNVLVGARG